MSTAPDDRRHDEDPVYLVRSIGRMAQMLLEIRDEYVENPTEDTLDQFERRLDEIAGMAADLRALRREIEASSNP
ncbi:MAG TPA: hypothetical protein VKZ96_01525 [Thermomicrobiales bacterium]|nr:hypothetical protein [Thermomicrobiales bacterium]